MNNKQNIARFETELSKIQRPGMDRLLAFIRSSDFYTAPASTKFHLSCEGGLLQHSLNVLDALRGLLIQSENGWEYRVAGQTVAVFPEETVIIVALLHDICKTYFYTTSTRNVKNEQTGKWEKVPFYTVNDKMPLGHGDKSAMIIKQYITLTTPEMYAIWWHMAFTDIAPSEAQTLGQAIDQYPLIWALHTADMVASHYMEADAGNKDQFLRATGSDEGNAGTYADAPAEGVFEEAEALANAT